MFQKPNYTQTPNEFFDDIAKTLKEGELRLLVVIMRQTFGWRKRWDRISLSQLVEKTGMCRDAVVNGIKSLVSKKIILKHKEGPVGDEKCWYTLMVEEPEMDRDEPDEFNESSNSLYQSSKTTPPSRLKRPTKETPTKETLSPIVPKGDLTRRKSRVEEKKEKATDVWVTEKQHTDLLKRCNGHEIKLKLWYDKLSTWKLGKGIQGGKNDYLAITNWVINAVEQDKSSPKGKSFIVVDANKELAAEVVKFHSHPVYLGHIQCKSDGLLFEYGREHEFIEFTDLNFRDNVCKRLKKMNLI